MRIGQLAEIVPVLLIETCEGCEDQHGLAIPNGIGGGGDIVHVIVHDRRRGSDLIRAQQGGLAEGQRGRRQRVGSGIFALEQLFGRGADRGDSRAVAKEEVEEEDAQHAREHVRDDVVTPERARDGHRT